MKLFITTAILGTVLTVASANNVNAKEVKELVGYNVTTVTPADEIVASKPNFFNSADVNRDGLLTLKEFKNKASLDDEYERFITLDTNNDKMLDLQEYIEHAPGKGYTTIREGGEKGTKRNWNVKATTTVENKFVPVGSEETTE